MLAVLFSIFMSRQIIKPLQRMIAGMRLTGRGTGPHDNPKATMRRRRSAP